MKSQWMIGILAAVVLICQGVAFAETAEKQEPVMVEEAVTVAEDSKTGNVVGEAVEVDELYAPEADTVKKEAKEEKNEADKM